MAETTTFEEAKKCPRCGLPGEDMKTMPGGRPGVQVHSIFCRSKTCPWYNTSWLVQINEDGTIPDAGSQIGEKQFPKFSPETETRVREALDAQIQAELSGRGEIRNPRG